MGSIIEGASAYSPEDPQVRPSSIALAAGAARRVLKDVSLGLDDVGLLVNAGVYRDGHICEPAMAPLILRAMLPPAGERPRKTGLLAFDLANGAAGMMTAFQAADALLERPGLGAALVVASDVDPTPEVSTGCDFESLGGAVVLRPGCAGSGFIGFRFDTSGQDAGLLESAIDWVDEKALAAGERTTLRFHVRRGDGFERRSVELACQTAGALLASRGLAVADVDLAVISRFPAELPERVADLLGLGPERVAAGSVAGYTAGPASGLSVAVADGRFLAARLVLFIAVGAGITSAAALYRPGTAEAP